MMIKNKQRKSFSFFEYDLNSFQDDQMEKPITMASLHTKLISITNCYFLE